MVSNPHSLLPSPLNSGSLRERPLFLSRSCRSRPSSWSAASKSDHFASFISRILFESKGQYMTGRGFGLGVLIPLAHWSVPSRCKRRRRRPRDASRYVREVRYDSTATTPSNRSALHVSITPTPFTPTARSSPETSYAQSPPSRDPARSPGWYRRRRGCRLPRATLPHPWRQLRNWRARATS